MKSQHTPGPWQVSLLDPVVVLTEAEHSDPCDSFVAMTMPDSFTGRSVATERDYANARLIAAAPDLLTALEDMLAEFGDQRFKVRRDFSKMVKIEAARAAIARAKNDDDDL